jgi:hypothetical protein
MAHGVSEQATGPDAGALASLERKLQLVRDNVTAVARGYQMGLYLYGAGGSGKSYTVVQHLEHLKTPHKLFNSRMTAKGLFQVLQKASDSVHLLEDVERLTSDRDAQGVLRSALWAQPGHERVVTWTTGTGGEERVVFRGGIIMTSNRPLADLPELRALATRIAVFQLDVTDAEAVAQVRDLAAGGFRDGGKLLIEPEQSRGIAEYLIAECRAAACPLDLRLLQASYCYYLQWEARQSTCSWQDLVASRVRQVAHHFRHKTDARSPEEKKAEARAVVREIQAQTADPQEQLRLYRERTGRSRADFFRRKGEVEGGEFGDEDGTTGGTV